MKIGLDGIPLGGIKTGVGHYTFELAQHLAPAKRDDDLQVVSHYSVSFFRIRSVSAPPNLRFISEPVNLLTKHWWTLGLPL
jgi:hypothetical protein